MTSQHARCTHFLYHITVKEYLLFTRLWVFIMDSLVTATCNVHSLRGPWEVGSTQCQEMCSLHTQHIFRHSYYRLLHHGPQYSQPILWSVLSLSFKVNYIVTKFTDKTALPYFWKGSCPSPTVVIQYEQLWTHACTLNGTVWCWGTSVASFIAC